MYSAFDNLAIVIPPATQLFIEKNKKEHLINLNHMEIKAFDSAINLTC